MSFIFILAALLTSCSTVSTIVPGTLDKPVRQDLAIKIDGKIAMGTIVVPLKETAYLVEVASTTEITDLFIETCHRHWIEHTENKQFKFSFTFNGEIEKQNCPLKISTLEKEHAKKEYATIVFEDERFKLPAQVLCNGHRLFTTGTSLCQGKAGKVQEVQFQVPVKMFSGLGCPLPIVNEGTRLDIPLEKGACVYTFSTFSSPHSRMILYTLGYIEEEFAGDDD